MARHQEHFGENLSLTHMRDVATHLQERVAQLGHAGILQATNDPTPDGGRLWSILGTPVMYSSPVTVIDGEAGRVVSWLIVDL
jgi:hypothetical protein